MKTINIFNTERSDPDEILQFFIAIHVHIRTKANQHVNHTKQNT